MKNSRPMRFLAPFLLSVGLATAASAQTIDDLDQLWHQAFAALNNGQKDKANTLLGKFNQALPPYLQKYGRDWKVEFLAGSLYCQFPQARTQGAEILKDVLLTNRDLNETGKAHVKSLLNACTAPTISPASAPESLSTDLIDTAAHYQTPGLHSSGKAGYMDKSDPLSGVAVAQIPAAELLARRVLTTEPQKALDAALARIPGSIGAFEGNFAITTSSDNGASYSKGVGKCMAFYMGPLGKQFEIDPPDYMITVYTAHYPDEVYDYAKKLHGLTLPQGVVAYSVLEDMSLSGIASHNACGSLSHELVHLLIKKKFPMSPAWLEEGLASAVAVAVPHPESFDFSWSWRDNTLAEFQNLRPSVSGLLETSWAEFSAGNLNDMRRSAALQAMAAVFIRYLSQQGKLTDVYFAARDQHLSADLSHYRSYREIVEAKLGKNIADVDRDFEAWFQQEQALRPKVTSRPCDSPVQGPCPEVMNKKAD